jgi:hypothetical protein
MRARLYRLLAAWISTSVVGSLRRFGVVDARTAVLALPKGENPPTF